MSEHTRSPPSASRRRAGRGDASLLLPACGWAGSGAAGKAQQGEPPRCPCMWLMQALVGEMLLHIETRKRTHNLQDWRKHCAPLPTAAAARWGPPPFAQSRAACRRPGRPGRSGLQVVVGGEWK